MSDRTKPVRLPKTHSGKAVLEQFEYFERRLWERAPQLWFASLLAPLLITLVMLAGIYVYDGMNGIYRFVVAALATGLIFGRFIILLGQSPEQISAHDASEHLWIGSVQDLAETSPFELFLLLMYLDLIVAAFLAFHLGFIFRIPFVGPRVADLMGDTQQLLAGHPWMRRASFVGLVMFVMFPTSTTGSVGGSIFGRLLGLTRATTFLAIMLGSLCGNGLMYLLAGQLNKIISPEDRWIHWVGIGICLLVVFFLERRYRHMQKTAREEEQSERSAQQKTAAESKTIPPAQTVGSSQK